MKQEKVLQTDFKLNAWKYLRIIDSVLFLF